MQRSISPPTVEKPQRDDYYTPHVKYFPKRRQVDEQLAYLNEHRRQVYAYGKVEIVRKELDYYGN